MLAHLRRCNLPEIDGVGRVVGAGPNRSVQQYLLEESFGFREFLLREIAIADVAVGEEVRALNNIAEAQAKAGDTAGARKTFESALQTAEPIQDARTKGFLQGLIARAQARAGDIAGAKKSVAFINYREDVKSKVQSFIAEAQAESGDIAGAKETLVVALKIANSIQDAYEKPDVLEEVVKVQAKLGDIPGAKETLAAGLKALRSIEGRQNIGMLNFDIAKAQLKAGDFASARESLMKYAASNPDPENEYMTKWVISSFQKEIDDAQAKAGSSNKSASTVSPIAVAQAPIPVIKVYNWVSKLDDNVAAPAQYSVCPLNTEPFLDLAGYSGH
jgi:Tfp pilus assembly protein PilF